MWPISAADLNAAISTNLRNNHLAAASAIFFANPQHRNTTSWNLLISGYARHGHHHLAQKLFDTMPQRDMVSWNAILAAHRLAGDPLKAFHHFLHMLRLNLRPTASTLATIVSASPPAAVPQIHASVLRSGHGSNTIISTALVGGYAGGGDVFSLRQAFDDIPFKNSVSWTALIVGYLRVGRLADARKVFDETPDKTTVTTTALISGYIAAGDLGEARRCFDAAGNRNAVTWTAMVSGYIRHGRFEDALHLFANTPRPNQFTYSAALAASAGLCSLRSGESIHAQILKSGEPQNTVLATALVDMYGRCGDVEAATLAFSAAGDGGNVVAVWNAMIGAMGRNGRVEAAARALRRMAAEGVAPDGTTFVHVLSACAHGGFVEEGQRVFGAMEREFGIRPSREHYGCLVDLYGRAGRKEEAEAAARARAMPEGADTVAAVAVATAGGMVEIREEIGAARYALMARVFGEREEWEKVWEMKTRMEAAAAAKGKRRGVSWVSV